MGVAEVVQPDPRQQVLPQRSPRLDDLTGEAAGAPLRVPVGAVEVAEHERRVPHEVRGQPSRAARALLLRTPPDEWSTQATAAARSRAEMRRMLPLMGRSGGRGDRRDRRSARTTSRRQVNQTWVDHA